MSLGEDTILNNRYRILRVLSDKGGMGVIYQAHDLNLTGTVVIKQSRFTEQELRQQYPAWPIEQIRNQAEYLRKAFEREAKLLFGLRHSALPRVIDYFATPDGNQFFVMEFIPGKDFGELLNERLRQNQRPFPLDQVLGWAEQILDVLHYLHTNFDPPIIHRDIKPMNLKLMPSGQVILLDFGLAKGARPGMSVVESIHGHTPHYAPLEQINRKVGQEQPTDPRSDLYSLAVTLYHLLTGQLPPDAVERVAETISGGDDPLRPARELSAQIPLAVSEALQRAAALNPNDRYPAAAAMREALQAPRITEQNQRIAIPAYFYPGSLWDRVIAEHPKVSFMVMNPASGPDSAINQDYVAVVSKAKAGSLTVIGYVHTSYGSRDPAVVKAEIDAYKTWYGVDGIFLDEVSADVAGVLYYRDLATYIKADPGRLVVLNPGTFPAEDYALVGDIILVFDDSYSAYVSVQTPAWVFNYPANKFWHVVYSAPTAREMREAIRLSRQRNGRHVYVSDGVLPNPYDSLPSYWSEELKEI
ncbi:MAG: spherulation-specific family 4 protein [Blastocatellia bacterium]